eukprot:SAG22_NODE_1616_length_3986_cov_2.289169_4_plen_78_part_00
MAVVPTLAALDLAGLRLSSRDGGGDFDTIESASDEEDERGGGGGGGGGADRPNWRPVRGDEADEEIFSRYTRASDWR